MKRNTWVLGTVTVLASVQFGGYGESGGNSCLDGCGSSPSCSCLSSAKPEATEQTPIRPATSDSKAPLDNCAAAIAEARAKGVEEGRAEAFREAAATASVASVTPVTASAELKTSGSAIVSDRQYIVVGNVVVAKGWWVGRYLNKRRFKRLGANLEATLTCNGFAPNSNPTLRPGQALKICKFK